MAPISDEESRSEDFSRREQVLLRQLGEALLVTRNQAEIRAAREALAELRRRFPRGKR